jgi:hypothetical protein
MTPIDEAVAAAADDVGMTRHVYPSQAMVGDYLRAAVGLVPTAALFATVSISAVPATILGGFAAIFAVFGLRTVLRHGTSLEMTEAELRARGGWHRTLAWAELDRMKLSYYSTARDRRSGWMQLELRGGGVRLGLDSRIEGFDQVVRRAAEAAAARDLALNESTVANLESLGIAVSGLRVQR